MSEGRMEEWKNGFGDVVDTVWHAASWCEL